jgi:L-asparaginase
MADLPERHAVDRRPRVVVIFSGGTIAMLPDPRTGAALPALRGADILARVPAAAEIAELEAVDWGLVPASHLSFGQVLEIAGLIAAAAARPEVDGVVVVQGTDVLEETVFAWDLLHVAEPPLVVVGAMRDAADPEWDGARNLCDAVRVAADPRLRGEGAMVVMGGLVLPADDAAKTHSQALDAFQAPNRGALGQVDGAGLRMHRARGSRRVLGSAADGHPARAADGVALITAVVATDGDLLRAALAGGAPGVVVEATGAGNTDPDLLAAAREAIDAGVPVVLATRCAAGPVGPWYGFPGGGRTWQEAGAILAGTLSGPKARVALALGLGAGLDHEGLAALIRDPG